MDSTSSSGSKMMIPYLHFTTGDYLYFKTWQPTSAGAIAGACIGLIVVALFDRWLAATRAVLDLHWRQRALALTTCSSTEDLPTRGSDSSGKSSGVRSDIEEDSTQNAAPRKPITARARYSRTVTPFIATHDIPRGILYSLQMLVAYLLMLAVMTFQAAFFISIVLGLGIGEILFGRLLGRSAGLVTAAWQTGLVSVIPRHIRASLIPSTAHWNSGLSRHFDPDLLLVPDALVRAPQKSQAKFMLDDRDLRRIGILGTAPQTALPLLINTAEA